jgi:NADPH-dependent 2,4-dienoyl-CoA reductase/sulfur reductase-like enzyme
MATSLRALGIEVTLFHERPHLLDRDEEWLTAAITDRLRRARVEVRLNEHADPARLPHDLVLLAGGLKPNVEPLAAAGADLGRTGALRLDERLETSLHGVYAAGDCAETTNLVSGSPVWIPLGTTANKMGRVAGANAAGARERFPGIVGTSIVRVAGLAVATTGLGQAAARRDGFSPVSARIEALDRPRYFRGRKMQVELVADARTRRLLGAAMAGDEGVLARINVVAAALSARMKVEDLAGLDLAYAPPYSAVSDPLLTAALQLLKLLD